MRRKILIFRDGVPNFPFIFGTFPNYNQQLPSWLAKLPSWLTKNAWGSKKREVVLLTTTLYLSCPPFHLNVVTSCSDPFRYYLVAFEPHSCCTLFVVALRSVLLIGNYNVIQRFLLRKTSSCSRSPSRVSMISRPSLTAFTIFFLSF